MIKIIVVASNFNTTATITAEKYRAALPVTTARATTATPIAADHLFGIHTSMQTMTRWEEVPLVAWFVASFTQL
jgi:hypothetical protein